MATVLAATVLAVGPLLHAPSAYAEDGHQDRRYGIRSDSQTVDFTGGSVLSMLMCRSEPSAGRLAIPAESRVMFVNRLGQNAVLRVNGKVMAQVGPDQAVPVVFHYGPVSVSMTFSCGAGVVAQFSSTSVSVAATARPEAPRSAAPRPTVSATAEPTRSASAKVDTGRTGRGVLSSAQPGAGALATVTADSPAASRSRAAIAPAAAAPSSAAPSSAAPSSAALSAAAGSSDSGEADNAVAVEPLVRVSSTSRDGSSGVLALIAAACAVGVTITVIRAIISKRTILTYHS